MREVLEMIGCAVGAVVSIGGAEGVKLLVEGRNRVAGFIVNKVGDRVTIMVSNPLIVFPNPSAITVDSGGRHAKVLDTGLFMDGSGSWLRVMAPKSEQVKGSIVMYKQRVKDPILDVKMVKLIYQEDGLINVWDHRWKKTQARKERLSRQGGGA